MKYIKQYENFFTDLLKKKKQTPSKGEKGMPLQIIHFNYKIGDIIKLIKTNDVAEIINQSYTFTSSGPIPIYTLDIDPENTIHDVQMHKENEFTTPTPEEIELYKSAKKYNL